jgi:hypothetical protein
MIAGIKRDDSESIVLWRLIWITEAKFKYQKTAEIPGVHFFVRRLFKNLCGRRLVRRDRIEQRGSGRGL